MTDLNKRIIYATPDGSVCVIIPCDCGLTIEQIAAKDVPSGRPYAIVDVADIPADRSSRHLWTVDDTDLTGGVGADYGAGSDNVVTGWHEDGTPLLNGAAEETAS